MLFLLPPVSATWTPCDRSRLLVKALERAIQRAGIPPKEAAAIQGLQRETQWYRQLHGRDGAHVSLFRASKLVMERPEVLTYWLQECAQLVNAHVITNETFRQFIDKAQAVIGYLEVEQQSKRRRMARMKPYAMPKKDRRRA